jgi:hypothetical protein
MGSLTLTLVLVLGGFVLFFAMRGRTRSRNDAAQRAARRAVERHLGHPGKHTGQDSPAAPEDVPDEDTSDEEPRSGPPR